jgi:hypothetical protein
MQHEQEHRPDSLSTTRQFPDAAAVLSQPQSRESTFAEADLPSSAALSHLLPPSQAEGTVAKTKSFLLEGWGMAK